MGFGAKLGSVVLVAFGGLVHGKQCKKRPTGDPPGVSLVVFGQEDRRLLRGYFEDLE